MLESLHIRNLALVTTLDLEFSEGLNVITGETGAGKSLIIGAINLIAGGRATPSVIRKGEKSCEISAIVNLANADETFRLFLQAKLDEAGILQEDDKLILRRVITESGSRAYVNATPVTIGFLREVGEQLIDIHGPHDNQSLLHNAKQLELLDAFANDQQLKEVCRELYRELENTKKQLDEIQNEGLAPEEADLLKHQLREIRDANLQPGEDEELIKRYKFAQNANRILEIASQSANALANDDNSTLDQIGNVLRTLRELETLDPDDGPQFPEQLCNIFDQIQTLAGQLDDYAQHLDLDPQEYQALEERLELVQKMKRKYGPALIDVFETQARIKERLQKILGRGERVQQLRQTLQETTAKLKDEAAKLDKQRRDAAIPLAAAIEQKLRVLGFNKAAFTIRIQEQQPGPTGANSADFLFAPNVGEDLQPLKNTASSGETARVMLAIKTVLTEADAVPILVFDEVDANIGGRVAATVADELRAVAKHHQVFSITHLPQIAAAADNHFLVEKNVVDERTVTSMKQLDDAQRHAEIIRMLGAPDSSTAALKHAQELIRNAHENH